MEDRGATTPDGTVTWLFAKGSDAERAVTRLRDAGFADVRLSERSGSTSEAHVPEQDGRTAIDFSASLEAAGLSAAEARAFTDGVAQGGTLLTLSAGDRAAEALGVLRGESVVRKPLGPFDAAQGNLRDDVSPADVASVPAVPSATQLPTPTAEATAPTAAGATPTATPSATPPPMAAPSPAPTAVPAAADAPAAAISESAAAGDRILQLREEQLDVAKERVEGEARVRKDVVTENRTITVPVQREELVVERDGQAPVRIPMSDEKRLDT
ncbi:MAG: YsnF/AvaK domain-containing protein [Candidatus Eremiobacteraeota bacterium]|nr:YsnF/AvaK domain-containing protein [Candidatus Eremiobacteraeota bacterium]